MSNDLIGLTKFRNDPRFKGIDGSGLAIAIIDTGIDLDNKLFGVDSDKNGIADRIIYSYDFVDKDSDASDTGKWSSHGSNVASIAASVAPKANIIFLKVFSNKGYGSYTAINQAMQWVSENAEKYNIAAVNMSIEDGGNYDYTYDGMLGTLVKSLYDRHVAVVCAAGNNYARFNAEGVGYPAAVPRTIAVGAVDSKDRIAAFSQRLESDRDTLFAPGVNVRGANYKGGTVAMSGTSQAAPHVAGAIALMQQLAIRELGRKLSVPESESLLFSTGKTINDGDDEKDKVVNTGLDFKRLDIFNMAEAVLRM